MRTVHVLLFALTLVPACAPKTGDATSGSTQNSGHTGTGTSGEGEGEGDTGGTTTSGTGEETSGPDPKLDMPDPTSSTSGSTSTGPNGDCGNGTIDEGEQCDGPDLGGIGCKDIGYPGGVLMCDPVICAFDTSNCYPDPSTTTSG